MSMTYSEHPTFCDPRCCETSQYGDYGHAEAGTTILATASDTEATVRLVQYDVADPCGHIGDVQVLLTLLDTASVTSARAGKPITAESVLSAADARLLGAALLVAADRCEIEQRRAQTAGGAR